MKYIQIPETLTIHGHEFPFAEYVHFLTENHNAFDASAAGIRAAGRIQAAAKNRGFIELRPEDYQLLAQANAAPSGGYPVLRGMTEDGPIAKPIAKQLLPYIEAIESATDEPVKALADVADEAAE